MTTTPQPFLKWAGGKRRLLHQIAPLLPLRIKTYYEPFLGGGAVFFYLASQQRFKQAVLGDINNELIETYRVVRDHVGALIDELKRHAPLSADADYYYAVRAQQPDTSIERAARFLFLNKTCFNGLYRVNRQGRFNVSFGRHKQPNVVNESVLKVASRVLQGVTLTTSDFKKTITDITEGDAVYFDPPYTPASPTSSFTAYHASGFGQEEHTRLNRVYRRIQAQNIDAVLSNADIPAARRLYQGLRLKRVQARRAINANGRRRGAVDEVLVIGVDDHQGRRAV